MTLSFTAARDTLRGGGLHRGAASSSHTHRAKKPKNQGVTLAGQGA